MQKVLCVCNTYFQLIVSAQLKLSLFHEDTVSVVLTDHSRNTDVVAERLRTLGLFQQTYYMQVKNIDKDKHLPFPAIKNVWEMITGVSENMKNIDNYDELLYYNPTYTTFMLYSHLYKLNRNIKCSRYEEGILSYNVRAHSGDPAYFPRRVLAALKIRKLLYRKNLNDVTKCFYCFNPELYKGNLETHKIPPVDVKGPLPTFLGKVFAIDRNFLSYPEKYIFFSGVYDFEGEKCIGEVSLAQKIADLVGKDNILIKQHPRDTRTVFCDLGLRVDKNSAIPWEAVQLSIDFSDKVFLTVTSGSVLSANLITESGARTYFLYKLCDIKGNTAAEETVSNIEALLNDIGSSVEEGNSRGTGTLGKVKIADKLSDIL